MLMVGVRSFRGGAGGKAVDKKEIEQGVMQTEVTNPEAETGQDERTQCNLSPME